MSMNKSHGKLYIQDIQPGEQDPCSTCKSFRQCRASKLACGAFHEYIHAGTFSKRRIRSKYWYGRCFDISEDKLTPGELAMLYRVAEHDQTVEELKMRYSADRIAEALALEAA